ncbi:MAG: tyrosine-type recombinase/integrase [Solirubrobacteraceae bacterium]
MRAIFKHHRRAIPVNPTAGLELPRVQGGRDRIASPAECAALLDALPDSDRAIWATAMYAGLRRGELMALRIEDVNLASGVIHVRRSWDMIEGEIAPKSAKGDRRVPIAAVLRDHLDGRLVRLDWAEGKIFGASAVSPFSPTGLTARARSAWNAARLARFTLHECRHTFASLMIGAGVNAKALSTYMGHANVSITFDRYGHLMPGNENEAASLLDAYLARASDGARLAPVSRQSRADPVGLSRIQSE